ncbi:hypothetical protein ACFV20_13095 [Streptomyces sp. NPDC059696]|uniref:hypothetical protein n=1 Tax=Streptomyces sp. NPDC059696 TaxID=3346911 RepID=UPI0036C96F44
MSEILLPLDPALRTALDDLADARGCAPEDVVLDAVRGHLRQETGRVRAVADGLARHHADLLRRLGE